MAYPDRHDSEVLTLRCDLHTHSVFSDGTYTPTELVAEAKHLGLIVALTDHNTVSGLPEFTDAARKADITVVPGTEFSTEYAGTELHLLGLFVLPEHYDTINAILREQHALKTTFNHRLIERLNQAGYLINFENIQRRIPGGTPNRAHMAAELLAQGYVTSIQEAFDTILGDHCGFYVQPPQLQLLDTVRELRRIGVLPVLAHPLQELTEQELRALLPVAKEVGLAGMETMHSSYTSDTIRTAEAIAAEFGLLPSGGSDFHGSFKPDITLGTGKGQLCIPPEIYENLLAAWERSR